MGLLDIVFIILSTFGVFIAIVFISGYHADYVSRQGLERECEIDRYFKAKLPEGLADDMAMSKEYYKLTLIEYSKMRFKNRINSFLTVVFVLLDWVLLLAQFILAIYVIYMAFSEEWRILYMLWFIPALLVFAILVRFIMTTFSLFLTGALLDEPKKMRKIAENKLESISEIEKNFQSS